MKDDRERWAKRYQAAIRRCLRQGSPTSLASAVKLGREAASLGLETLDVALIHELAMKPMAARAGSAVARKKASERAKCFFSETIGPIEQTHLAAQKADVRVNLLIRSLRQRTLEAKDSARLLERSIAQRVVAEASLKRRGQDQARLLQESNSLQSRLKSHTCKMLSAQEVERKKTSLQLQDEVAQTLLAIHIRLLALKVAAKASGDKLEREIDHTQRLVNASVKRISRFAHEFAIQPSSK